MLVSTDTTYTGYLPKPIIGIAVSEDVFTSLMLWRKEMYFYPNYRGSRNWQWKLADDRANYGIAIAKFHTRKICRACLVEIKDIIRPCGHLLLNAGAVHPPEHPEWGEPELPHWTVKLGKVLLAGDKSEINQAMTEEYKPGKPMK